MHTIHILGTLGQNPEITQTKDGTPIAKFSLASKVGYGEKARTEWFRCVAFKGNAQFAQYLSKGDKVYVIGQIKTDKYTGKDGTQKTSSSLITQTIQATKPKAKAPILAGDEEELAF